jgi:hypothetical protein
LVRPSQKIISSNIGVQNLPILGVGPNKLLGLVWREYETLTVDFVTSKRSVEETLCLLSLF